jgi:hypothetical protein
VTGQLRVQLRLKRSLELKQQDHITVRLDWVFGQYTGVGGGVLTFESLTSVVGWIHCSPDFFFSFLLVLLFCSAHDSLDEDTQGWGWRFVAIPASLHVWPVTVSPLPLS